jgi:uncharacterized Rmd1/YagE family protein
VGERIDVRRFERGESRVVSPVAVPAGRRGRALLFRYGVVVLIDVETAERDAFVAELASSVSGPFAEVEHEEVEVVIDPGREEGVDATGAIVLHDASLEKLEIVSEVLARSLVLAYFEGRVARVFERIEPLATGLKQRGRRSIRSRDLLHQIGDVLLAQIRTVGRVEVAEKPELTWERPDLDALYERLRVWYELRERDVALTRKLDLIGRNAEGLLALLDSQHALRVEWYIVALIAVEIVLVVYDLFGRA